MKTTRLNGLPVRLLTPQSRVEIINGIIESYHPELIEKPVPETDEVDNPQTGNIRTEPYENDDESKDTDNKKTVLKTEAKHNEQL